MYRAQCEPYDCEVASETVVPTSNSLGDLYQVDDCSPHGSCWSMPALSCATTNDKDTLAQIPEILSTS